MSEAFPFLISPSQKERIGVYLGGPRADETENEFAARCNRTLTQADRDLIVAISDHYAKQ